MLNKQSICQKANSKYHAKDMPGGIILSGYKKKPTRNGRLATVVRRDWLVGSLTGSGLDY